MLVQLTMQAVLATSVFAASVMSTISELRREPETIEAPGRKEQSDPV